VGGLSDRTSSPETIPDLTTVLKYKRAELLKVSRDHLPQFASRRAWRDFRSAVGRAITIVSVLALPSACADPSASLDRKMSEIRREQCDPLPTQSQRAACIRQVNEIEDDALRQLDEARRQQAIQGTMDQVRVINQAGR
jgi:hypothetical protein